MDIENFSPDINYAAQFAERRFKLTSDQQKALSFALWLLYCVERLLKDQLLIGWKNYHGMKPKEVLDTFLERMNLHGKISIYLELYPENRRSSEAKAFLKEVLRIDNALATGQLKGLTFVGKKLSDPAIQYDLISILAKVFKAQPFRYAN